MADVHAKLDELTTLVTAAKSMPLSASCVLPRAEVLSAIDEVRQLLPGQLAEASDVLAERADVVDEGRAEAAAIIEAAFEERARLIGRTEVAREAALHAEAMTSAARESARLMRAEVEDYVDGKLANFEVVLQKTLHAVERGRDKLRGRVVGTDLRGDRDLDPED